MACCCHIDTNFMASLSASAQVQVEPPKVPVNLSALVALCLAQDSARADQRLLPLLPTLPTAEFKIDPKLAQISALLALGPFDFSDPIRLNAQMNAMAGSLNTYITPSLKASLKVDVSALMKLAAVANAMLTIKAAGLDPFSAHFSNAVNTLASRPLPLILPPPPSLPNLKVLAALPDILKMTEVLKVPLSDPAAASIISAKLSAIASITPPTLSVKISALLTLAAVANAVAMVTAAFGASAFGPSGASRISFALKAVAGLPPLPAIDLSDVDLLPPMDSVVLGSQIAGKGFMTAAITGLKPPSIKASAFISASVAMQAALSGAVNVPPLSFCTNCGI